MRWPAIASHCSHATIRYFEMLFDSKVGSGCRWKQKRCKWAKLLTKLKASPSRSAVPLLFSASQGKKKKLDFLTLGVSIQNIRHCPAFILPKPDLVS